MLLYFYASTFSSIPTCFFPFFFPAKQIKKRLHRRRGQRPDDISLQTVRNRLHEVGLRARRPKKKVKLTDRHRQERIAFARRHRRWGRRRWANVLFSDECRFYLRKIDGRMRVWRWAGVELNRDCIVDREGPEVGGVMMWGGISSHGKTELVPVAGRLTAQRYVDEVLEPHVIPYAAAMGDDFIFMDDNARPHHAQVVDQFV